jgi:hypothetical protein
MAVGTSTDGPRVWVCNKCLAGGDQKIDGVLEQRALLVMEDAARNAEELRSLIGKIRTLPTHKQWKAEAEYRVSSRGKSRRISANFLGDCRFRYRAT